LVGLAEPVHPTGLMWALIASEALFPILLIATAIVSLRCRTRRCLWVLGALAAVAAANVAISLILYPQAVRSACLQYIAKQGTTPIDSSCLAES
jgi:membrane protein YdbS with pleckstrin-like domain